MDSLLPSERARLVLGYLEEESCTNTYKTFLEESKHLNECLTVSKEGKKFSTKVMGRTLKEILDEYCTLQSLVEEYAVSKSISSCKNTPSLTNVFRELINSDKNPTINTNDNSSQSTSGNQTLFFRINFQQHGHQATSSEISTLNSNGGTPRTRSHDAARHSRNTLKRDERRSLSGSSIENHHTNSPLEIRNSNRELSSSAISRECQPLSSTNGTEVGSNETISHIASNETENYQVNISEDATNCNSTKTLSTSPLSSNIPSSLANTINDSNLSSPEPLITPTISAYSTNTISTHTNPISSTITKSPLESHSHTISRNSTSSNNPTELEIIEILGPEASKTINKGLLTSADTNISLKSQTHSHTISRDSTTSNNPTELEVIKILETEAPKTIDKGLIMSSTDTNDILKSHTISTNSTTSNNPTELEVIKILETEVPKTIDKGLLSSTDTNDIILKSHTIATNSTTSNNPTELEVIEILESEASKTISPLTSTDINTPSKSPSPSTISTISTITKNITELDVTAESGVSKTMEMKSNNNTLKRKAQNSQNKVSPLKRQNLLKDDFLVFSDLFIKNHGLQDKIAESINKALHQDSNSLVNPETSHTTHSSEVQGELIPGTSTTTTSNGTHDETVRTILTETENDPAFADFLEEFIVNLANQILDDDSEATNIENNNTNPEEKLENKKTTSELPLKQRLRSSKRPNISPRQNISSKSNKNNKITPTNKKIEDMNQLAIQGIINSGSILTSDLPLISTPVENNTFGNNSILTTPQPPHVFTSTNQMTFPTISILSPSFDLSSNSNLLPVATSLQNHIFVESSNIKPPNDHLQQSSIISSINNLPTNFIGFSPISNSKIPNNHYITQTPSRNAQVLNVNNSPFDIDKFCLEKCPIEVSCSSGDSMKTQDTQINQPVTNPELTLTINEQDIIVVPTVIMAPLPSVNNIISCNNIPGPKIKSKLPVTNNSIIEFPISKRPIQSQNLIFPKAKKKQKKITKKSLNKQKNKSNAKSVMLGKSSLNNTNQSLIIIHSNSLQSLPTHQSQNLIPIQNPSQCIQVSNTFQSNEAPLGEPNTEIRDQPISDKTIQPEENTHFKTVNNEIIKNNNIVENFQKEKANVTLEQRSINLVSSEPFKGTPKMHILTSNKGHSHSTPRRKSHIRVLDFTTPSKISDTSIREVNTSPKAKSTKRFFADNDFSSRRSRNFVKIRGSLFRSPSPSKENTKNTIKPQNDINIESKLLNCVINNEKKNKTNTPLKNHTVTAATIATRSPATPLSGAWDKVTGIGSMLLSTSEQSSPVDKIPTPKKTTVKKSWDSDLRALLGEQDNKNEKKKKTPEKKPNKTNINDQAKLIEKALIEDNKKDIKKNKKKNITRPKSKSIKRKNCKTKVSPKQLKNSIKQRKQKNDISFSENNSENNTNGATNSIINNDSNLKDENRSDLDNSQNNTSVKNTNLENINSDKSICNTSNSSNESISDISNNSANDQTLQKNNEEPKTNPSEKIEIIKQSEKTSDNMSNVTQLEEISSKENLSNDNITPEENNLIQIVSDNQENLPEAKANSSDLINSEKSQKELSTITTLQTTSVDLSEQKELMIPSVQVANTSSASDSSSSSSESDSSDGSCEWDSSSSSLSVETPLKNEDLNVPKENFVPMTPRALIPLNMPIGTPLPLSSISSHSSDQTNLTHIQTPLFPPTPKIVTTPSDSEQTKYDNSSESSYYKPNLTPEQAIDLKIQSTDSLVETLIVVCSTLETQNENPLTSSCKNIIPLDNELSEEMKGSQSIINTSMTIQMDDLEKKRLRTCEKLKALQKGKGTNQTLKKTKLQKSLTIINKAGRKLNSKVKNKKSTLVEDKNKINSENSIDSTIKDISNPKKRKTSVTKKKKKTTNQPLKKLKNTLLNNSKVVTDTSTVETVNSLGLELTSESESDKDDKQLCEKGKNIKKTQKIKKPSKCKEKMEKPENLNDNKKCNVKKQNKSQNMDDILHKLIENQKNTLHYEINKNDKQNPNVDSEIPASNIKINLKKVSFVEEKTKATKTQNNVENSNEIKSIDLKDTIMEEEIVDLKNIPEDKMNKRNLNQSDSNKDDSVKHSNLYKNDNINLNSSKKSKNSEPSKKLSKNTDTEIKEPEIPTEKWKNKETEPTLFITYQGLGFSQNTNQMQNYFDEGYKSEIVMEDDEGEIQIINSISPFINLLNLEPQNSEDISNSLETKNRITKSVSKYEGEIKRFDLEEKNSKEVCSKQGDEIISNSLNDAESSPIISSENKNLPPKKRKPNEDLILKQTEKKICQDPKDLLKRLDVDKFLDNIHGEGDK